MRWSGTHAAPNVQPRGRMKKRNRWRLITKTAAIASRATAAASLRKTINGRQAAALAGSATLARWPGLRLRSAGPAPRPSDRGLAGPQVEIGGTAASLEDQPRPGNGAPSEIGAYHRLERPPLEVRSLKLLVQADAVAGLSQAIPELDVLDRWLGVTLLIEPTDFLERVPTDRATTGPEGRSFRAAALMDEMMQQVAILRDRASGAGVRVVRTEDGRGTRWFPERGQATVNGIWGDDDVGVHEEQDVGPRPAGSPVACRGRAPIAGERHAPGAAAGRPSRRVVARGIVHDDDLAVGDSRDPQSG